MKPSKQNMSAQLAALLLIAFAGFLPAQTLQRIPLTCTVQGDTLTLSWPTVTNTGYFVYQGYDPVVPLWSTLAYFPVRDGSTATVTIPASGPLRYYLVWGEGSGGFLAGTVGHVRRLMFTGTNLIANPFNTTNHTLGYLLPNCPDGTQILKNSGVASECQGGVWNPADVSLNPGEGAILVNPSTPFEIIFAGEVPEGVLSNPIPTIPQDGWLISSKAPVRGLSEFPAKQFQVIQTWNPTNQTGTWHWYFDGSWWDEFGEPAPPPVPQVGEAFWIMNSPPTNWVQHFVVHILAGPPVIMYISSDPSSRTNEVGTAATFAVEAAAVENYQWLFNGTNLTNGGNVSGADTAALTLTDVQTNDAGSYAVVVTSSYWGSVTSSIALLTIIPAPPPIALAEALDTPAWTWTTGENAGWIGQTNVTHDGTDAARSGTISANQESWMEATVSGPGTLTFWWKVSSEANHDFLEFHLNGALQTGRISGEGNWQQRSFGLSAGPQTLRWRYLKDSTGSSGQDRGWVDQVSYVPDSPPEIAGEPQSRTVMQGYDATFTVNATGTAPLAYQWKKDNVNLTDVGHLSGSLTNTLTLTDIQTNDAGGYSVVITNAAGSVTSEVAVLTVVSAPTLAEALDTPQWAWITGGDAPWTGRTNVTHDAVDAARSGAISHNQQGWMEATVSGPGTLKFWWKVSSETGYDYLEFYLNEALQPGRISGEENWQQQTFALSSGLQTLRWRYMKNSSTSSGQDRAWVDQVNFTPDGPPPPVVVSPCYPVATNTAQPEFALSSAFDSTNFLIGIRGNASSPDGVGAQLLSPAGNRVGGLISNGRVMDGPLVGPRVVFGGSNYLMVWTDAASQHSSTGNDVYAQFVSPAGSLVGNPFPITSSFGDEDALAVAFDGVNFAILYSTATGLRGRQVSLAGQVLPGEPVFTAEDVQSAAAAAYGGGQYLVTWVEGTDGAHVTKGRVVPPVGEMGDVLTLSQTNSYYWNPISVACGGGRFLVVWHHNAGADTDSDLRGRIVLPNGTMVGDELVLAAGPNDEFAWANNVVFDGQYFLVVWTEFVGSPATGLGTVRGRYWSLDGDPVGTSFVIGGEQTGQLGVGLSAGAGSVLAVINTGAFTDAADVCARFITLPFVQIAPIGPQSIKVTFNGVLQSSTNFQTWIDYTPQPTSPWIHQIGEGSLFFRARAD